MLHEFKDLYAYSTQDAVEKSNIYYVEMVDENPNSSDTMRFVAELLLSTTASNNQEGYIILVGDGKTYQHLMEIKHTYGASLHKLLISPGEWHTLANFQPVLMKIYYHAGLKQLAQASGFRTETLTSLEKCSNFARTHHFLLQAWQTIYSSLIAAFNPTDLTDSEFKLEDTELRTILIDMETFLESKATDQKFKTTMDEKILSDDTWKFWYRFFFSDCFCYIQLFLAIRCGNWHLRNSALKQMAPLFFAFDRTTYQRLIPYHLADLLKFPPNILKHL